MRLLVLALSLLATVVTAHAADGISGVITGTVTYRERMALPPGAVLEVQLRNVSLMDVQVTVIASQSIESPPAVPIPFRLEFTPEQIEPHYSYALSARIMIGGELAFINDRAYPVLTHGHPDHAEMVLHRVNDGTSSTDSGKTTQADHEALVAAALEELDAADLRRVDGTWQEGTITAQYSAFLQGDVPVLIVESRTHMVPGKQQIQYFYDGGRLRRYQEESQQTVRDGARPPHMQAVSVRLYFDGDTFVTGWKTVGRVPAQPEEHEVRSAADQARRALERLKGG